MPVSGSTTEFAPYFGFLDSDIFLSGSSLSAHLLRTVAMNGNHMAGQTQCVFRSMFNVQTGDNEAGTFRWWLSDFWKPVVAPQTIPKPPGCTELEVRLRFRLSAGDVAVFQPVTQESPFSPLADDGQLIVVTGTGDWQMINGSVRTRQGAGETFGLMMRGILDWTTDDRMNAAYGDDNGPISSASYGGTPTAPGTLRSAAGSEPWPSDELATAGHYIIFTGENLPHYVDDVDGPHDVVGWLGTNALQFYPPSELDMAAGMGFLIFKSPDIRFASITAFTASGSFR